MATWAQLTPEQQGILAEYTRQLRAAAGQLARLVNVFEALNYMYDAQVADLWALLDSAEVIQDGSGLAGVSDLREAEVMGITVYGIKPFLTTNNTPESRELYVKIAGLVNTL